MNRVIVLGGTGFFGRLIAEELRAEGMPVVVAARGVGADLWLDAEDSVALRAVLRSGDLVVDAAGPFRWRSVALIEAAIECGADVIDLSEDLGHAERVWALASHIQAAGIRVLHGCSAVSAIICALVRASGIAHPRRVSVLLSPATRETASGTVASAVLDILGEPIGVWRHGMLANEVGWGSFRRFGSARGYLVESAMSIALPVTWPSLQTADFYVDAHAPGANGALSLAARFPLLRALVRASAPLTNRITRLLGLRTGRLIVEVEDHSGRIATLELSAERRSYLIAVAPAVLAARAIVRGAFEPRGFVRADQQVVEGWLEWLAARGTTLRRY